MHVEIGGAGDEARDGNDTPGSSVDLRNGRRDIDSHPYDVTSSKEYQDAQAARPEASPPVAALRGGSVNSTPRFEDQPVEELGAEYPPELLRDDSGGVLITLDRVPTLPAENDDVRRTRQPAIEATSGNSSTVYDYGLSAQLNQAPVETLSDETKAQIVSETGAHIAGESEARFSPLRLEDLDEKSDSLQQQLMDAFYQHPHNDKGEWLPINKLMELINPSSVKRELGLLVPKLSEREVEDITNYVCKRHQSRSSSDPGSQSSQTPKYTGALRIFAILVLIEKTGTVQNFITEDLSDKDLPFGLHQAPGVTRLKRKGDGVRIIQACRAWTPLPAKSFYDFQWKLLSPFFSRADGKDKVWFYPLEDRIVLPFIEDTERQCIGTPGGYGTVWRIKIHPSHHNFDKTDGEEPSFAVKKLTSPIEGDFNQEVETLKKFSNKPHNHLIKLLATFKWAGSYYLLFPWADGNLRDFWFRTPNPILTKELVTWVAEQCYGISTGLFSIHHYQHSSDPKHLTVSDPGSGSRLRKSFGRHGDIKPENILWFERYESQCGQGILKISDFGLTRFHSRYSRSGIAPRGVPVSPTYRPPEYDLPDGVISQAFDLWQLGCLYLEFITWLLNGYDAVNDDFSSCRASEDKREDSAEWVEDTFFKILVDESGKFVACVKDAVIEWVDNLHSHPNCTEYLHRFLDFIMRSLLVPDPKKRTNCADIVKILRDMWMTCQSRDSYCVEGVAKEQYEASRGSWDKSNRSPSEMELEQETDSMPERVNGQLLNEQTWQHEPSESTFHLGRQSSNVLNPIPEDSNSSQSPQTLDLTRTENRPIAEQNTRDISPNSSRGSAAGDGPDGPKVRDPTPLRSARSKSPSLRRASLGHVRFQEPEDGVSIKPEMAVPEPSPNPGVEADPTGLDSSMNSETCENSEAKNLGAEESPPTETRQRAGGVEKLEDRPDDGTAEIENGKETQYEIRNTQEQFQQERDSNESLATRLKRLCCCCCCC